MTKQEYYVNLLKNTEDAIRGDSQQWMAYLRTAAQLYKYPYQDQIMIYAQQPNATAVADYDIWNKHMGRYIPRGTKGIALFDANSNGQRFKYVWDIKETRPTNKARNPWQWAMKDEYLQPVSQMLREQYQAGKSDIPHQLFDAAQFATNEYWDEYCDEILHELDQSKIGRYLYEEIEMRFKVTAETSVYYSLLSRSGYEPEQYMDVRAFPALSDFNSTASLRSMLTAVSVSNQQILRSIENKIRTYERSKQHEHEQREVDLRTDGRNLSFGGRSADSGSGTSSAADGRHREVRTNAESVSARASAQPVRESDIGRHPVVAPVGGAASGRSDAGLYDAETGRSLRSDGGTEGTGSDEMGRSDEHQQSAGRGDHHEGTDLRLNSTEVPSPSTTSTPQLSFFPGEAEQLSIIENSDFEAENVKPFSAFSFSQHDIDLFLQIGSNAQNHRMTIIDEFSKQKPLDQQAEFLKEVYMGGAGMVIDNKRISAWYLDGGMMLSYGSSARLNPSAQFISWTTAAERIEQLLESGQFATSVELVNAPGIAQKKLAEKLWYLQSDLSEAGRKAGLLTALQRPRSGFPDETKDIAQMLSDQTSRKTILEEMQIFVDAYHADRTILRFNYHTPDKLLADLQDLNLPRKEYHSEILSLPEAKHFITEDELDAALTIGSIVSGGKGRIYDFFRGAPAHSTKEKAEYLKNEYGTGGRSPGIPGAWFSGESHDYKGIKLEKQDCPAVKLSWEKVAQRIDSLIRSDQYFSLSEKEELQKLHDAHLEESVEEAPKLSQKDIDAALRKWNESMDSKRAVVRYLQQHEPSASTVAWLKLQYGSDAFVVNGQTIPWTEIEKRLSDLIEKDDFFTSEEFDNFENIDPIAIREKLESHGIVDGELVDPEKLDNAPFIQQVMSDTERIAAEPDISVEATVEYRVVPNDLTHNELDRSQIQVFTDAVPGEILGAGRTAVCEQYVRDLNAGSLSADQVKSTLDAELKKWHCYIVPDLMTWNSAAAGDRIRTPIELYDSYEDALSRFRELRTQAYNTEQIENPDGGLPYARLTFGIQRENPPSATDLLHVRAGKNYLVDDFTRSTALYSDPDVMSVLNRMNEDLGFDRINSYTKGPDGIYLPPVDMPFAEWENPYLTPQPDNRFVLVDQKYYLQIQATEEGYDYTIFDAETKAEVDGGLLSDPGSSIASAQREILQLHGIAADEILPAAPAILEPQLDQYPVPNPSVSVDALKVYGYDLDDLLPATEQIASEFLALDLSVYVVADGAAPRLILDAADLKLQDGMLAVLREEWEHSPQFIYAVRDRLEHQPEREQGFLSFPGDCYAIYQVKRDDPDNIRFMNKDWINQHSITVSRDQYDLVYTGMLPSQETPEAALNRLYKQFNLYHPVDFRSTSMSVSDVVVLKQGESITAHFVDSIGFAPVPEFLNGLSMQIERSDKSEVPSAETVNITNNEISDVDFARENLIPGETTFEWDGRNFLVDRVNFDSGSVNLQDITFETNVGFPIFRVESITAVRNHLENPAPEVLAIVPDQYETGDRITTPRGTFSVVNLTVEQMQSAGYGLHHYSEDGKYAIMAGNNRAFATPVHPLELERTSAENFHITDAHLGEGGPKAKFIDNLRAIQLLKQLELENRQAEPDEQEILSRYVGWGGLSDAFDPGKDNWRKEYQDLKEALTPAEYDAARASTLNAHYTSPTVIKAIYEAVGNMGFETGNILEPSCGVGNFFGMLPQQMQNSRLYGVELDSISGRIAQQLYPKANITVAGFETTDRKDFFDLAIGNVPFGNYRVSDKPYDKLNFSIHNYFFAKALDQVRPGGVVAFITSRYTMDSKDSSARTYIAQRAELLGAIRLPNDAFKKNAGAEVVSDIIFLQKRDRPLDIAPDWTQTAPNDQGYMINQYFIDHPEMVLGNSTSKSTAHGMDYTVAPIESLELSDQLHDAVKYIHGTYKVADLPDLGEGESIDTSIPANPDVANYSYTVVDGQLYYRQDSRMYRPNLNATAENRVKGMIELRSIVNELIDYQLNDYPDAEIVAKQQELNTTYDKFSKKWGLLNSKANKSAFSEDASYYLLSSLEEIDDAGKLKQKADIFTKRTVRPVKVIDHASTPMEALTISMSEHGKVDLEYMTNLLDGMEASTICKSLNGVIYRDPEIMDEREAWKTADDYLSGNVRKKLYMAKLAAKADPQYQVNVAALEKAQPKDLDASEIEVRLGATWIDKRYIKQFLDETFDLPWYLKRGIQVEFAPQTDTWHITGKNNISKNNIAAYSTYGTERVNGLKVLEDSLNLRDVQVFDIIETPEGKEKRVLNQKETILASQKQQALREAFKDWIWQDPQRRHDLTAYYNTHFNDYRPREYDGSKIVFGGMNPEITLKEHQRNAIAHILYGGNTLLAHEVGAGKTFEMIASAMESKRLGLCNKPMFVVPKHLVEQWGSEFMRLYPAANILVTTERDFKPENRRRFCARIATGNYDAVIIAQSQFLKIPVSEERQKQLLESQLSELEDAISHSGDHFSVKEMERTRKTLEKKLHDLVTGTRPDNVVTFEQLGVDRLYIDESQYYKNLGLTTKMRNVAGISTTDALKSSDLYMKCRYLDEITNNKGVIFASGTPVSNSMTELYTVMRYLQHDTLQQHNLSSFDAWASTFGETVTAMELTPDGSGFRNKTRFARFFNLPELMNLFREVADIKTADQLDLKVPKAHFQTVAVKPSACQKDILKDLSERASAIHTGTVDPSIDNMLKVTNDGRKLGLDQRLIDPSYPDNPDSKLNACVKNVYHIWEENKSQKLTQLIFCDLSTPKKDGSFNVYDDIKNKLIANGIPKEEIAFIHDATTDDKKDKLFANVRNGQVRVLLGSTDKMGAGTNCQERLVAVHHLDVPWRPSDMTQRNGRIIRQGNDNTDVQIYQYVTESTFDAYMYQTLENKQSFISQIMTSRTPMRSCDDIDEQVLSYAEIKAICAGDPRIKEKMTLDTEVANLKLLKANYQNNHYKLEDKLNIYFPKEIDRLQERIKAHDADLRTAVTHPKIEGEFAGMTIGSFNLDSREAAGNAILAVCQSVGSSDSMKIGSYRGFDMELSFNDFTKEHTLRLHGSESYPVTLGDSASGNITRIDNAIEQIADYRSSAQTRLDTLLADKAAAEKELLVPFAKEDELQQKSARLAELNILLDSSASQNPEPEHNDSLSAAVIDSNTLDEVVADSLTADSKAPESDLSQKKPISLDERIALAKEKADAYNREQAEKNGPQKSVCKTKNMDL